MKFFFEKQKIIVNHRKLFYIKKNFTLKPKLKITFFLILIFSFVSAQMDDRMEILLSKIQTSQNPVNSIKLAFELLKKAEEVNDIDKIKYALFAIGDSYYSLGEYSKALNYCNLVDAESGSDIYLSKIYVRRVRSFIYEDLGMIDKSVRENNAAIKMASAIKNKNSDDYHKITGLLWRDKSIYYTHADSILKYDRKNLAEFLKLKKRHKGSANLSMPYNNVGHDYVLKDNLDSALHHYKKAEYYARDANDESNLAFVFQSYGDYYRSMEKSDSAIANYKKSIRIAQKFGGYKLAQSVTNHIRQLYLAKGDKENSIKYDQLSSQLNDSINIIKKRELSEVVSILETNKDNELKKSNKTKYLIIVSLLLFAMTVSTYAIYQYIKNKKDYLKFTKVIEGMEKSTLAKVLGKVKKSGSEKAFLSNISDEKEQDLTKKLNNFERKEHYLSPEISLGSLASNFNTNVNYLSKVIKKHKDHNFSSYINELRINYITNKLRSNPEYLNYKIAYLAEECGFTSYSSFVSIFKQQTGITPSKFIEYLNKED